jgi:hypothetical protein
MEEEVKEWLKVTHGANNTTSVTCSLVQGSLAVKWSVKAYSVSIKEGVREARQYANKALQDLREAIAELAEEAAAA